jgi:hypothetical protein
MRSFSLRFAPIALKLGLTMFALIAAGCASATVTPEQAAAPVKTSRPRTVYVLNFAVVAEDVKESHGVISQTKRKFSRTPEEQRQMEIGHSAATELSNQLAKDLRALGFNVEEQIGEVPATGDVLLVEGQFLNVDEGAATRRVMVGFGVGKSTLDSQVQVYRIAGGSRQKLLEFTAHADSGKLPGTALTMGAGAVVTGGATAAGTAAAGGISGGKAYLGRVNYLADKTADQVNAYLSHYFAEQGWISADKARAEDVNVAPKAGASTTPNNANTL